MANPKKKPKATGPARMLELGRRASQLWYTPEQYDLVKKAAKIDGRPMTEFAKRAALKLATIILARADGLVAIQAATVEKANDEAK